jgi:hypothetical protein
LIIYLLWIALNKTRKEEEFTFKSREEYKEIRKKFLFMMFNKKNRSQIIKDRSELHLDLQLLELALIDQIETQEENLLPMINLKIKDTSL